MATNALMNQAVRENRFLRPNEYSAPETWLDRLGAADTNPLVSAGLALLTTGQGSNPLATAFQSFTNAAKNKQAAAELDQQQADLINAEVAMTGAPDYNTYQKALASYAALPGADKNLMSTTAAIQRERLTGVPLETGMVVDPSTGQQTYRDPIPFGTVLDQKKQLSDLGYEDQQRMSELEYKYQQQGLDANQSRQKAQAERMAELEYKYQQQGLDANQSRQKALEEWMATNGYGNYYQKPGEGGGSMVYDPSTGGMVYEQGPTKGQQQAQAGVYAARQKADDKLYNSANAAVGAADQLVTMAGQLTDMPWLNKAAGAVEGAIGMGGAAGEAMQNMLSALTPLAIGMHPGGPMTDADLKAYQAAILNPSQSTEARVLAAKRAQAGAQGNQAYLQAQREWFDTHNGSLAGFDSEVGNQLTEQWRQHRNSLQ